MFRVFFPIPLFDSRDHGDLFFLPIGRVPLTIADRVIILGGRSFSVSVTKNELIKWTIIAQQLPGRTDIDVKNHWNSKLRKKLKYMGVDPVTHKPFSQILAEYKNIEGLSSSGPRIRPVHNDMKHAFMVKTEPYSMIPFSTPSPTSTLTTSSSEPMIANSSNSGYYSGNYSLDLLT
ncbi:hypothetical protein Drorol1_Dr00021186 [Drosera rotundifolia]